MFILFLIGCGPADPAVPEHLDTSPPPTLSERLVEAGMTVQEGVFLLPDLSDCCEPGGFCSGTNPSSPYGQVRLPPAPGAAPDDSADASGLSAAWRLGADESVVIRLRTPPVSAYFGFTHYLMGRWDADLGRQIPLFASLGDSFNQLTLATGGRPRSTRRPRSW